MSNCILELEAYNLSEFRNDKIAAGTIQNWDNLTRKSDFCMTLKNYFGKCLLFALPDKENPTVEKALFDWTIVLQYR